MATTRKIIAKTIDDYLARVTAPQRAAANHCAFYPGSGSTVAAHADLLKGYDISKCCIRFQADKPLPATLVHKLVQAGSRQT